MYVVAGVSGHTGSVVASTLLAQKQPVRVVVREAAKGEPWKQKGAEVAVADLKDEAALTRALAGAKGFYTLLAPPPWGKPNIAAHRKAIVDATLGAVKAARPGHVVFLSSVGAHIPAGTGPIASLRPLEQGLRDSGIPSTFLRAAAFHENWGAMIQGAVDGGTLYYGVTDTIRFPQVATTDIGRVGARLLVEGGRGVRIVELAGPAEYSVADVAATIAKISGKPVKSMTVPVPAMIASLTGMGASADLAAEYGEMAESINSGLLGWELPTQERGTVTLEQRLRELMGK
ncbi:MAG: NmrA family NAD(P)-binding protein [Deltaproteobacteria bacterium]|nr:NmrA family NAD(P)-binding protein [Deltaproteobacteria bacterium]